MIKVKDGKILGLIDKLSGLAFNIFVDFILEYGDEDTHKSYVPVELVMYHSHLTRWYVEDAFVELIEKHLIARTPDDNTWWINVPAIFDSSLN